MWVSAAVVFYTGKYPAGGYQLISFKGKNMKKWKRKKRKMRRK
jgi:hypothetical protein